MEKCLGERWCREVRGEQGERGLQQRDQHLNRDQQYRQNVEFAIYCEWSIYCYCIHAIAIAVTLHKPYNYLS